MINRKDDQYKNGLFTWFIGSVEEINDPKGLNRIKVRAYGYHDSELIKTKDLPWATVMMPVTSAGVKGSGGNHHLQAEVKEVKAKDEIKDENGNITQEKVEAVAPEPASWVVGFFRDGPSAQDPVVIGSIATQTPTGEVDKDGNPTFDKDLPSEASVDNKVYKSKAGHLIEIDNTDGAERIKITHSSGSTIAMGKDRLISINGSIITITSDTQVKIV